ncbi:hypothetical protein, partial [Streptomyces sp. NPDC059914]|uniref:hypothetical protein n=1 Tax=Streptomyces sp. NPDC059914 TaxID=3347000 RepID=UPI00364D733A
AALPGSPAPARELQPAGLGVAPPTVFSGGAGAPPRLALGGLSLVPAADGDVHPLIRTKWPGQGVSGA